jgi:hypothetical protein
MQFQQRGGGADEEGMTDSVREDNRLMLNVAFGVLLGLWLFTLTAAAVVAVSVRWQYGSLDGLL